MRIFVAVCFVVLMSGCGDKSVTPKDIIPPAKMKWVMYDMMRTGEFLSGFVLYQDTIKDKTGESMKWYNKVWQTHKISEAEFRKSYGWYQLHPEVMQSLMDSIMVIPTPPLFVPKTDSVNAKRDSLNRVDSIKKRTLLMRRGAVDSSRRRGIKGI